MDPDLIPIQPIHLDSLSHLLDDLKEIQRDSDSYIHRMAEIRFFLNNLEGNQIKGIDLTDLTQRNSWFVFFEIDHSPAPVPYDLAYVIWLNSRLQNRLLVLLKGHRRYLRKEELDILSELERARSFSYSIDFKNFKLDSLVSRALGEMSQYEALAKIEKKVTRKLDLYYWGLRSAYQLRFELECLGRLGSDSEHLRHSNFTMWFNSSFFHGNTNLFKNYLSSQLNLIDERCQAIVKCLKGVYQSLGGAKQEHLPLEQSWQDFGPNVGRGSHILIDGLNFNPESLSCRSFQKMKPEYDFGALRDQVEAYGREANRAKSQALVEVFKVLETKSNELTRLDGPVYCSMQADFKNGKISKKEYQDGKEWAQKKMVEVRQIQIEVFDELLADFVAYPKKFFPKYLKEKLIAIQKKQKIGTEANLPQFRERWSVLQKTPFSSQLLGELIGFFGEIESKQEQLNDIAMLIVLRRSCKNFHEFENRLVELFEKLVKLDQIKGNCLEFVFKCFRSIKHSACQPAVLDKVFDLLSDFILINLRNLDYSWVEASRFETYFEKAVLLSRNDEAYQLDTLLREMHLIPRHEQLQNGLEAWEERLTPKAYQEKQAFLFQNEIELQKLVQKIRNELRECLTGHTESVWTRRNRFEVFGMGDYYGPNLQPLLDGLLRMVPSVSSLEECKRLVGNIEFIESKVHEAHLETAPKGSAFREVKRLSHLMGSEVLKQLLKDLEFNQKDLDHLLQDAREGLQSSQVLLKRLGLPNGGREYLSVALNLNDLDELQDVYDFVDEIELSDIKRFVLVYNHKIHLMEELYERAMNKEKNLTKEVAGLFNSQAFKDFQTDFRIKDTLKFEILNAVPQILEAEAQLLNRTLNFVRPDKIKQKSTYSGILQVIKSVGPRDHDSHQKLRKIWSYFQRSLESYSPERFSSNFRKNVNALFVDVAQLHRLPFPLIQKSSFLKD